MKKSILAEYPAIYGGELQPDEEREISKFASALVQAKNKGDASAVADLIKEAAAEITEYADFEALMGLFDWLQKEAELQDKTKNNIAHILALSSAAFAATPAIVAGVKYMKRKHQQETAFRQILKDYPALRDDPNTPRYFKLLVDFAPDIASNPLVAGNVLDHFRRLGPSAITPSAVNELSGLQRQVNTSSADAVNLVSKSLSDSFNIGGQHMMKVREMNQKERMFADKQKTEQDRAAWAKGKDIADVQRRDAESKQRADWRAEDKAERAKGLAEIQEQNRLKEAARAQKQQELDARRAGLELGQAQLDTAQKHRENQREFQKSFIDELKFIRRPKPPHVVLE